jgi:hypothetical protein
MGGGAETLDLFLKLYPQSPYALNAAAKLKALGGGQAAAPPASTESPTPATPPSPAVTAAPTPATTAPSSAEDAKIEAISFLGVLGLSIGAEAGGLIVSSVAKDSELAGKVQPGARLARNNGEALSSLSGFADDLTYQSYSGKPIVITVLSGDAPLMITLSKEKSEHVALGLQGVAHGSASIEYGVWKADTGRLAPELAASFAILNPNDPYAPNARKYALALHALKVGTSGPEDVKGIVETLILLKKLRSDRRSTGSLVSAIENYQRSMGREPTGVLSAADLAELLTPLSTPQPVKHDVAAAAVAEVAEILRNEGLDASLAGTVFDRATELDRRMLKAWGPPRPPEVFDNLQRHYKLRRTAKPSIELIVMVAREQQFLAADVPNPLSTLAELTLPEERLAEILTSVGIERQFWEVALESRTEDVYLQVLGKQNSDSLSVMLRAIQSHYSLPPGTPIDLAFLRRMLSEPVTLSVPGGDAYVEYRDTGDWKYSQGDKVCFLATAVFDTRRIGGAFLDVIAPRVRIRYTIGKGSALAFLVGNEILFQPGSDVFLVHGNQRVPMVTNPGGGYEETQLADGSIKGLVTKMFARSTDVVSSVGTSRLGGDLKIDFSAKGFGAAFKAINDGCAKGKLSPWVK